MSEEPLGIGVMGLSAEVQEDWQLEELRPLLQMALAPPQSPPGRGGSRSMTEAEALGSF